MITKNPQVSVVLPVYNGEKYLTESIASILAQTFEDFEFIIINDGSSDRSEEIIRSFADSRIRYFSQANQGLSKTLNRGIALASGKYIARQDQDDISLSIRLEKQVLFLEENPCTLLLGTHAQILEEDRLADRMQAHPLSDAEIRLGMLFDNFFVHSSVMIRREALIEAGGYSEDITRQPPEDYELWSRIMRQGELANLAEPLLVYREVANSMSRSGKSPFGQKLAIISAENLAWAASLNGNKLAISNLAHLMAGNYENLSKLRLKDSLEILNLAMTGMGKKNADTKRSS